jgi:RNA polymerase subunit RPABC4/transcription elongation factor Spt4
MPINRTRISKRVKEKHQSAIRNVVKGLSRKVLVYKQPKKMECPNCYYDKFTEHSTGKCKWTPTEAALKQEEHVSLGGTDLRYKYFKFGRCPVCRGDGYVSIQRKTWVDALIIWDPGSRGSQNTLTYTAAGTEGSTIVQLKADPKYYDLFKNCKKMEVDGIECKISKPPILRGLGVQAVLIITAFTTEKPKIDSGEIIKDYS